MSTVATEVAYETPATAVAHEDSGVVAEKSADRIHYMDNVRAFAMLLGVFLHVGMSYGAGIQDYWVVTDSSKSSVIAIGIGFIHLFRMGLFFLIAGYFAKFLVQRRGLAGFVRNRLLRIVLPFVIFYPLLVVAFTVAMIFAIGYVSEPLGLLGLIKNSTPEDGANAPGLTTMHLWFLYYLAMFSVLAVGVAKTNLNWMKSMGDRLFSSAWVLLGLPLLLLPSMFVGGQELLAPESFTPQLWPFLFYGLYFFSGWTLHGRESFIARADKLLLPLLLGAIVAFVTYEAFMPQIPAIEVGSTKLSELRVKSSQEVGTSTILLAVATCYASAWLVSAALLLGRKLLDSKKRALRFIADSSYWVYLIHLPIVVVLQAIFANLSLNTWVEFTAISLVTMAVCILSYLLLVRYTPIGTMLNGKKKLWT